MIKSFLILILSLLLTQYTQKEKQPMNLNEIIVGPHRSTKNSQRNPYCDPVQILKFFEVEPQMLEIIKHQSLKIIFSINNRFINLKLPCLYFSFSSLSLASTVHIVTQRSSGLTGLLGNGHNLWREWKVSNILWWRKWTPRLGEIFK